MEQTELTPAAAPQGVDQIGPTGARLVELTKEIEKEIARNWNEKTMEVIEANGAQLISEATALQITTPEEYQRANDFFIQIKQYEKRGGEFIDPMVDTARQPWAVLCDIRRRFERPATEANKIVAAKITAWKQAERRRAEEEQRRLDAERRAREEAERREQEEKARQERERAEKARREQEEAEAKARKAEQERLAAEEAARKAKEESEARARKAEQDRLAAEEAERKAKAANDEAAARKAREEAEAIARKEEQERIAAEESARKAQEEADRLAAQERSAREQAAAAQTVAEEATELADAHEMTAQTVFVAPTIAAPTVSKTEVTANGKAIGISDFNVWIEDELEMVKGVAAGRLPLSVLNLDPKRVEAALKRWAKVSLTAQRYHENGVIIEATERLSARASTKEKALPEQPALPEPAPAPSKSVPPVVF